MVKKFDFDDINLIPRYSVVDSRSECDTSVQLGKFTFKNPVIPSNMESVIDEKLAMQLAKAGYFYVLHRFNIDSKSFIKNMKEQGLVSSISMGVNEDSYILLNQLIEEDLIPDYITIDIAHGHCKKMKKMLRFIKEKEIDSFIIAGNVSSIEATVDLDNWGADAIKCGIGPGCFMPNAKILTKKGIILLKNIKEGDYVLTHKNRYKKVIQKHVHIHKDSLIQINDIEPCTYTHEFYIVNKYEKELINEENLHEYAHWIKAEKLDKNKHLLIKM